MALYLIDEEVMKSLMERYVRCSTDEEREQAIQFVADLNRDELIDVDWLKAFYVPIIKMELELEHYSFEERQRLYFDRINRVTDTDGDIIQARHGAYTILNVHKKALSEWIQDIPEFSHFRSHRAIERL